MIIKYIKVEFMLDKTCYRNHTFCSTITSENFLTSTNTTNIIHPIIMSNGMYQNDATF